MRRGMRWMRMRRRGAAADKGNVKGTENDKVNEIDKRAAFCPV